MRIHENYNKKGALLNLIFFKGKYQYRFNNNNYPFILDWIQSIVIAHVHRQEMYSLHVTPP